MKKIVLSVGLMSFLVSGLAFGLDSHKPWDVCQNVRPDHAKDKCYAIVDRHGKFDEYAVGACFRLSEGWDAVRCLGIIEGHTYTTSDVDMCDAESSGDDTNRCFEFRAGHYFDPAARTACDRIQNDEHHRSECYAAIRDRHFVDWQVKRCDNYETPEGTVNCFRNLKKLASLESPDFNEAVASFMAPSSDGAKSEAESALKSCASPQAEESVGRACKTPDGVMTAI